MHIYEEATNTKEKIAAGDACTNAIMQFWKHRHYNTRWNPLDEYSELLEKLDRLTSKEYGVDIISFIYSDNIQADDLIEDNKIIRKVCSWLIEHLFLKEYGEVNDENDELWLSIIDDLDETDAKIIPLISNIQNDQDDDNEYRKYRIKRIEYVIELLKDFCEIEKGKKSNA